MSHGIILGASSGVGQALAVKLGSAGDELVLVARRAIRLDEAGGLRAEQGDIRDYARLDRIVAEAQQRHPLDYIVNCVGVGFFAPIGADHGEAWEQILATNIRGLLNLLSVIDTRCPLLGQFVHVSSLAAHRGSGTPGNLAYSVSKAGARTIVEEYRRGLRQAGRATRVSMVSPGFIEQTDFGRNFFSHAEAPVGQGGIYGSYSNLSAADAAEVIRYVLATPPHVEMLDVVFCPTEQP